MFGSHFYHATMRKSVAVFGTLFNNISVIRKDGSGGILNQIKVPLAYGPKQKFLARLDQNTMSDASMAIQLPRMAFEITSLELDLNKKENKRNKLTATSSDTSKRQTIKTQTPYNIGMSLHILAKNQDDGLQVLEQILPYFQPDYTVTIKPIDGWTDYRQDVPIILNGVTIADEYEGDFVSRRILTYQLDFIMKMTFYSGTGTQGVIKSVDIDWYNKTNTSEFYEGQNFAVTPTTATENDTLVTGTPGSGEYNITATMDYLNVPSSMTITLTNVSGTFAVAETVTGGTTLTTAKVTSIDGTTMVVSDPSGYFTQSETLTGGTSTATATISQAV